MLKMTQLRMTNNLAILKTRARRRRCRLLCMGISTNIRDLRSDKRDVMSDWISPESNRSGTGSGLRFA